MVDAHPDDELQYQIPGPNRLKRLPREELERRLDIAERRVRFWEAAALKASMGGLTKQQVLNGFLRELLGVDPTWEQVLRMRKDALEQAELSEEMAAQFDAPLRSIQLH